LTLCAALVEATKSAAPQTPINVTAETYLVRMSNPSCISPKMWPEVYSYQRVYVNSQ